jgi:hypothetical protein
MLGYGIKETTATTGTGTLTLSSVANYPRFSNAFIDGDLCCYSLLDSNGAPLECGVGTYTATNTLARTYPLVTYTGGTYDNTDPTALSLSGTTTVICTGAPQSGFPFLPGIGTAAGQKITAGQNPNTAGTSSTFVALTLYVIAHQVNVARPITAIRFRIAAAAAAGKIIRVGLYRVGTDGVLGTLLQTSGDIAADTTGIKSYTLGAATTYPPGWYGVAAISDGAPQLNASSITGVGSSPFGADANNIMNSYITTTAASAVLPNPFTGTITNVSGSSIWGLHLVTA